MIPGIGISVSKLNSQKLTPMWIALDFNGYNYMYYSYDATTWVRITIAWAGKSVANNGKMWVMGCAYGRMQYSVNGINWKPPILVVFLRIVMLSPGMVQCGWVDVPGRIVLLALPTGLTGQPEVLPA